MAIVIRIGVLSLAAAIYMTWAFRGIENKFMESAPAMLQILLAYAIPTLIAVAVYKKMGKRDEAQVAGFAFIFWLVAAAVVTAGWMMLFGLDAAAAGFFRDNVIVGLIGLVVLVLAVNFGLSRAFIYFTPKRRR